MPAASAKTKVCSTSPSSTRRLCERATQEQLDQEVTESDGGIQSATLNEGRNCHLCHDKAYHDKLLRDMADSINSTLAGMVGSETYPNITAAEASDDFTSFTITTTSTELSMDESFSVLTLYSTAACMASSRASSRKISTLISSTLIRRNY